MASRAEKLVY